MIYNFLFPTKPNTTKVSLFIVQSASFSEYY